MEYAENLNLKAKKATSAIGRPGGVFRDITG